MPSRHRTPTPDDHLQGDSLIAGKANEPKPIAAFEAWIGTNKSSILAGGDGGQVKFELPGSEQAELLKLIQHGQNKVLQVVVFAG